MIKNAFCALIIIMSTTLAHANLVANPGFETEGSSADKSEHWEDNATGGTWGSSVRSDWKSHRGNYSAALRGAWSGADHGGLWQTCPVAGGRRYVLSAVFMWDNEWAADQCELRIEWYQQKQRIGEERKAIEGLPEAKWTLRALSAVAPVEADEAHVVLDVSGIKQEGVLYVDEICFELE